MKRMLIFVIIVFLFPVYVFAEEETTTSIQNVEEETTTITTEETTTTTAKCDYATKANLNKLAGNVDTDYQMIYEDDGTTTFRISIYNIVDDIYIYMSSDYSKDDTKIISVADTNNGTYTFDVDDDENIITYTFVVRSTILECTSDLRKIKLVKPKKNKIYELDVCKYDDVKDYSYCQEYITKEFTLTEDEIIAKIEEQRNSIKKITTTECTDCDSSVTYAAKVDLINQYKMYIVIGLSIGIVLDMIYIYLKISDIRRSRL